MLKTTTNVDQLAPPGEAPRNPTSDPLNFIFFKSERMYAHRIVRFNYTTYDVRRAQDVVNPRTSHRNIMLLDKYAESDISSEEHATSTTHPFLYAQVIGIYHVNVIYTGPGMVTYNSTRFDFLWVRWYEHIPSDLPYQLDRLSFPAISSDGAFGFVDPADVLRSCHIIPAFGQLEGTHQEEGEAGVSQCARSDFGDSKVYYIGR